jgi:hypothetical protein
MFDKPLVIVEWRDIIATSGWEQEISCPTLFTLGWLISQDDDTTIIANTVDFDDFTGDSHPPVCYGLHAFPAGAVVKLHHIQKDSYPISFERLQAKEDQREPFHI